MPNVVKIIIKDKFVNKLIALKLKEETTLLRVVEILRKRYEHLQNQEIGLYLRGEELTTDLTLLNLIRDKQYTEKERVELNHKKKAPKTAIVGLADGKQEPDFVKMMAKGGEDFARAIAEILIRQKVIYRDMAESTLETALNQERSFITCLIEDAYIKEKDILTSISRHLEIPSVDLVGISIDPNILELIPKSEAETHCVLVFRKEKESIWVAMPNPFDTQKVQLLQMLTGMKIEPVFSLEFSIRAKIQSLYTPQSKPAGNSDSSSPEESPLPDDFFSSPPKKKATLIIKDGKKIDSPGDALDQYEEEFDAPTLWADKEEELPETFADNETTTPGAIWDAPTLMNKDGKMAFADKKEEQENKSGLEFPNDNDAVSIHIPNDQDAEEVDAPQEALAVGIDLPQEGPAVDIEYSEQDPGDSDHDIEPEEQEVPIDNENGAEEEMPIPALGGEIPIYAGLNPADIPEAIEISAEETSLLVPDSEQNAHLRELIARKEKEETAPHSDLVKTERIDFAAKLRDSSLVEEEADDLAHELGITSEEIALEEAIRTEDLGSELNDFELDIPESEYTIADPQQFAPQATPVLDDADQQESQEAQQEPETAQEQELPMQPDVGIAIEASPPSNSENIEKKTDTLSSEEAPTVDNKLASIPPTAYHAKVETPSTEMHQELHLADSDFEMDSTDDPIMDSQTPEVTETELEPLVDLASHAVTIEPPPVISTAKPLEEKISDDIASSLSQTVTPEQEQAVTPVVEKFPDIEPESLSCEVTLNYYKRMRPLQTLPLKITLSKVATEEQSKAGKTMLKVISHIPGMVAVPPSMWVELTDKVDAQIWLTSITKGNVRDGKIQICYQHCIKDIPISLKVVKSGAGKWAMACGLLIPLLTFGYANYGDKLLAKCPQHLQQILSKVQEFSAIAGGITTLGLAIGGALVLLALVLFAGKRAKLAKPIVQLLEWTKNPA